VKHKESHSFGRLLLVNILRLTKSASQGADAAQTRHTSLTQGKRISAISFVRWHWNKWNF